MKALTPKQKARAAECIAIGYSHLKNAQVLIAADQHAAAIPRLYYAAYFGAQASLADLALRSKKHTYWIGQFNKRFGRGTGWVPKSYVSMLNQLSTLREDYDYRGAVPNDEAKARSYLRRTENFLNRVRKETPLLLYPEFIQDFLLANFGIEALEFDYYCPKSYLHKERVQMQVQAESFDIVLSKRIRRAGSLAIDQLRAKRKEDYVLGWNNRFGQGGNKYLLFMDIDENDEGKVKSALNSRKGWLFKSGEGFHFVGMDILASRKLWQYRFEQAGASKGLKDLIDQRHVEFSIRRGYSTLRMTESGVKPFIPFMCWDNTH